MKVFIEMLATAKGSDDGITVHSFHAGEHYEVGEPLAKVFVEQIKVAKLASRSTDKPVKDTVKDTVKVIVKDTAPKQFAKAETKGNKVVKESKPAEDLSSWD